MHTRSSQRFSLRGHAKIFGVLAIHLGALAACSTLALMPGCTSAPSAGPMGSEVVSSELPAIDALNAQLPAGRYLGYLKVTEAGISYPIMIDLISKANEDGQLKMLSIVKVLNGGFGSFEYRSDFFSQVSFDPENQQVSFGKPRGELASFELREVVKHNGYLRGKLKLSEASEQAEFFVRWQKSDSADLSEQALLVDTPVQALLTGTYGGQCGEAAAFLQVEALPNPHKGTAEAPLWHMSARLAEAGKGNCSATATSVCVSEHYDAGSWDFMKRQLTLHSTNGNLECQFGEANKLRCGECQFTKSDDATLAGVSEFKIFPRPQGLPAAIRAEADGAALPEVLEGAYEGWLFHEQLGRQQRVSLDLQGDHVSVRGVASLHFGSHAQQEYIAYRVEGLLPSKGSRRPTILHGPGEALLVVTRWAPDAVAGIWFGKSFGRVGEFFLSKGPRGAAPILPQVATMTGSYQGADWSIAMQGRADVSEDARDYYPIKLYGQVRPNVRGNLRYPFLGGIYNFYKGVFAFSLQPGSHFFGITTDGDVNFYRLPMPKGTAWVVQAPERTVYHRLAGPGAGKVATGKNRRLRSTTRLSPAIEKALQKHIL